MKREITFISDTHGRHLEMTKDLPGGWMIIHCGDVSNVGRIGEINEFTEWFSSLPYQHKIFIAGNHDFAFEEVRHSMDEAIMIPKHVIYLQDDMVTIDGINIYGSPWQPEFRDWAFNLPRGEKIKEKWNIIPSNADIVVTHGPCFGVLDYIPSGVNVGCEELYKKIMEIRPKIHACGHIHDAYGMKTVENTTFINACNLDEFYNYQNVPIVVNFDEKMEYIF